MRAWLMDGFDGIEKLRFGEVSDPRPGPNEALLRVRYAALNPADAFLAQAMYPAKPSLPHILGRDGVGEVIAVGSAVDNVRVGHVRGILRGDTGVEAWGTLAEFVVVPQSNLAPIPEGWTLEEMAGAPLVFLTAWQALTQWAQNPFDPQRAGSAPSGPLLERAQPRLPEPPPAGSVLLVTGASGGVGTAAVILGKSMDLHVVALSRSPEKAQKLKDLGADSVFDPTEPEWTRRLLAEIKPKRVDLVIDMVAGPMFNDLVGLLGNFGCISVVGRSAGAVPEFNTARLFFRRNRIGGVAVSDYTPIEAQQTWREIVHRLDRIHKRPVVDSVHPFSEVRQAFHKLAQGPMGKVLVQVS